MDARANKHNEYPIRASFSIKSQKLVASIGISVSEEVWNNGKVRSKKYTNSKGITGLEINSTIRKIENHFAQYELELERRPSAEELKAELKIALGNTQEETDQPQPKGRNIFDDLNDFIQEQSIVCQWAYATLHVWKTFTHHLEAFGKKKSNTKTSTKTASTNSSATSESPASWKKKRTKTIQQPQMVPQLGHPQRLLQRRTHQQIPPEIQSPSQTRHLPHQRGTADTVYLPDFTQRNQSKTHRYERP